MNKKGKLASLIIILIGGNIIALGLVQGNIGVQLLGLGVLMAYSVHQYILQLRFNKILGSLDMDIDSLKLRYGAIALALLVMGVSHQIQSLRIIGLGLGLFMWSAALTENRHIMACHFGKVLERFSVHVPLSDSSTQSALERLQSITWSI